jgi:hypothetical protein
MGKKSQKRRAQEAQKQIEFKTQQQAGLAALGGLLKKASDIAVQRAAAVKTVVTPAAKPAPLRPSSHSAVIIRRPGNDAARKIIPASRPTNLDPSRERLMHMAAQPIAMNRNVAPIMKAAEPKKATMPMTYQSSIAKLVPAAKIEIRSPVAAKATHHHAVNNPNGIGAHMVSKQKRNKGMFAALKYAGAMAICATLAVGGYLGYQSVKNAAPMITDVSAYAPKTISTRHDATRSERPVMKVTHSQTVLKKAPIVKIGAKKHAAKAKAIKTAKKHDGKAKAMKVKVTAKKAKKTKKVRV